MSDTTANGTIDDLLKIPGFAAYQGFLYGPIANIILEGTTLRTSGSRIGALLPDFGLTEDVTNGTQEILSVANVLAAQGYSNVTLIKAERPDFTARLPCGEVGIEHTRVYTGYQRGSDPRLMAAVTVLSTDSTFRQHIGELTIVIDLGRSPIERLPLDALADPAPQGFMSKTDADKIAAELQHLAEIGYFQNNVARGRFAISAQDALTLAKFHANIDIDKATSPEASGINLAVTMWKPGSISLLDECERAIQRKTNTASAYPNKPGWLVIQVVEHPGAFDYDLSEHAPATFGLFKKVFVLYWHGDGRPYVTIWSADANGQIAAIVPELPALEMPYDFELHDWASAVEEALVPRRIRRLLASGNDAEVPKLTSDPVQVQWHRKWLGAHPWMMAATREGRVQMIFWIQGDWDSRRTELLDFDDVAGAADRIWDFVAATESATKTQCSP